MFNLVITGINFSCLARMLRLMKLTHLIGFYAESYDVKVYELVIKSLEQVPFD